MTIAFELQGEQFVALNGGPGFPFTNAVSPVVNCETQEEIDHFWKKLAADGASRWRELLEVTVLIQKAGNQESLSLNSWIHGFRMSPF